MKNIDIFPLTGQDINILRTKIFMHSSNRDWECMEPEVKETLAFLKRLFIASKLQVGLRLDCYGYWPTNEELTKWVASDGSKIECSLPEMLANYGGEMVVEYFELAPEHVEEDLCIPKRMRQAEFEDTYM